MIIFWNARNRSNIIIIIIIIIIIMSEIEI